VVISGEAGAMILDAVIAHQMDALVDGDAITCSLIAACIADALRKGETPRDVAEALWEKLPSDEDWNAGLLERVERAIELREAA
jgi:hypothetical protein